jgi:glycosyltransferase involved in cell wall biosynthesis
MNLIFVSHCDFTVNSGMHLFAIANVLSDLGHSCVVCVPEKPETVFDLGEARFQTLDYSDVLRHGPAFADERRPDLVHAWTPRELVRELTTTLSKRYSIPYFVHLEDNEMVILVDELLTSNTLETLEWPPERILDAIVPSHRSSPHRARTMLAGATGITVLIDRLLEHKPQDTPGLIFYPGYSPEFVTIGKRNEKLRISLGVKPSELLVVYTGEVHHSNYQEVTSLVRAIDLINRWGISAKLIKTGRNRKSLDISDAAIAPHILDLGFVPRGDIAKLLGAADVLVQPGRSNPFNDYRFPSKLPEFLASGRPVILPKANIGHVMRDGEEAILLDRGDPVEIATALQRLAANPALCAKVGQGGRNFAIANLNWEKNVCALPEFYATCLGGRPCC